MKNLLLLAGFLMLGSGVNLYAQECANGLPFTNGAEFEMQTFNDKNKLQSTSRQRVTAVNTTAAGVEATIEGSVTDEKGKAMGNSGYTVKCENGVYKVDMKNMIDPAMMKSYEGMEVSVQADNIEVPVNAAPGVKLNDAKLTMVITGPFKMTNTVSMTNREVTGKESLTTPAGTFECLKISYDVATKFMVNVNTKVEEWYCPEFGTVQSKHYDEKGKLMSYSQLTSVKR